MERVAVLALAYGGPESLEQVEPFLRRIMAPRLPSTATLERAVARYERIGGGSPLLANTREQARLLEERLNAREAVAGAAGGGRVFRVVMGMRHTAPDVGAALRTAAAEADRSVVAVVLASHQSERATGGYLRDLTTAFGALPEAERVRLAAPRVVETWHTAPSYLEAVAERVREAVARLVARTRDAAPLVVFTAHSLPLADGAGDPDYERALLETVHGVLPLLPAGQPWVLAYQSAGVARGGEWLGPDVGQEVKRLAAEGVRSMVVMPLGFVSEHLETLFDLDVELAGIASEAGVDMERAGTVQGTDGLVDALVGAVFASLAHMGSDPADVGPSLEVMG